MSPPHGQHVHREVALTEFVRGVRAQAEISLLSLYSHRLHIQNTHTHKHTQVRFADALVVLREVNLESLEDPDTALCFWLNVYHTLLVHATMLFGPPLTRWKLWSELCYDIGGCPFSLLEIEHCVLRARLSKPRHQPLARFFLPKSFVRGSKGGNESMCTKRFESILCSTQDPSPAFVRFQCFKRANWTNS